jgi:hypothetical protein
MSIEGENMVPNSYMPSIPLKKYISTILLEKNPIFLHSDVALLSK